MIDRLELIVFKFLDCHWDRQRPLLLAFSGGPDSLALLHLLLSFRKKRPLSFTLAHVDHGWRLESREEVQQISLLAEKLQIPLHVKKLMPEMMKGNLEAACREERLKFFVHLSTAYHYQAVLLGHHADDFAETVLKRVLEGSSLSNLGSLREITEVFGIKLWRPLLSISKNELAHWLASRSLEGFDDYTNRDVRFLRARFRENILPQLSHEFGKQVSSGLCRIGNDSAELGEYLDQRVASYLEKMTKNPIGRFLDLTQDYPKAMLEMKYLVRKCCESEELSLSKESVELVAMLLIQGAANKQVTAGHRHLYIDRRRLFVLSENFPLLPTEKMQLQGEMMNFGGWTIRVQNCKQASNDSRDWHSLWQQGSEVILPQGEYHFGTPELTAPYPRTSSLAKWWTNHKIPAFLRLRVPVIYSQSDIVYEFLTGKRKPVYNVGDHFLKITLSF